METAAPLVHQAAHLVRRDQASQSLLDYLGGKFRDDEGGSGNSVFRSFLLLWPSRAACQVPWRGGLLNCPRWQCRSCFASAKRTLSGQPLNFPAIHLTRMMWQPQRSLKTRHRTFTFSFCIFQVVPREKKADQ